MPAGDYAVLRFTPDAGRDEPINIGVVMAGPAGALFMTDPAALERMREVDPDLDPETCQDIQEYMTRLTSRTALKVGADKVEYIEPWKPGFLAGC